MKTIDLGIMPYRQAWNLQHKLHQAVLGAKAAHEELPERLLLVEHEPVYTLGFHGNAQNMLASEQWLQSRGIEVVRIERGGDITFHGPGQLVAYPIIDLESHGLGVKTYVALLEQAVIDTLAHYSIKADRVEGATGVWVNVGSKEEAKICAIGVKCSRFVTMHGLALNVNTDLSFFHAINPCGFTTKGVTSMQAILGRPIDMAHVKTTFTHIFLSLLPTK
ncbi:MAG: lipoyl(octanoyl) transferase LipB [Bacteroidales bacterium]|nr:lipoyl(octanoyl) transferase LipB [Bacteroidales bacterium]